MSGPIYFEKDTNQKQVTVSTDNPLPVSASPATDSEGAAVIFKVNGEQLEALVDALDRITQELKLNNELLKGILQ